MPGPTTDRLLLDVMLGKLATYLRMCGYDAAYALEEGVEDDDAILARVRETDRTLVTRDRELAARAPDGLRIDSRSVTGQLRELAAAGYPLSLPESPVRCSVCNGRVERVPSDVAGAERTPDDTPDPRETPVWRCTDCGQCFWKGSHWDDVAETLAGLG